MTTDYLEENPPISDDETDSMAFADPDFMRTFTMNQLMERVYSGHKTIIEDLLHTGVYLLCGAPKIGKSFLVVQIAYCISTGSPLWNLTVRQGDVLYLALEDDEQRLQQRTARMFGLNGSDHLHFSVASKQVGNGLTEQLNRFLRSHDRTVLIIIDTLQKARESTHTGYSYPNDYDTVSILKEYADLHDLCILVVHHTRKLGDSDPFMTIGGTNGLLGAADGALLMTKDGRTDNRATLEVVGRDIADQKFILIRDPEHLTWELERAETELWKEPPDPILDTISALLAPDQPDWSGTPTELAEAMQTDLPVNRLTRYLNVHAAQLMQTYHIRYEKKSEHSGRRIYLTLLEPLIP